MPFLNAQRWALLRDVDVEAEFVLFFNRKSLAVRLNIPFLSLRMEARENSIDLVNLYLWIV